MLTCEFPLLLAGLALSVAGLALWRTDGFWLLAGAGNVLVGLGIAIAGTPLGLAQDGTVNVALGVALLWWWLRRRCGRGRARRWLGAKSAAIRAMLSRRAREAAQPA